MEKIDEIRLDYDTLFRMLNSPDEENPQLAMSLLESVDFKKNLVLILLLFKKSKRISIEWKEWAPKLWAKIQRLGVQPGCPLTYKDILKIMQDKQVAEEQVALFVQAVNNSLQKDLCQYGYDFIEKIQITIKPKMV
jgi:hypothetical protein